MLEDFQNIFVFSITVQEVVANVAVALLCGLLIAFLYRITYRGINYSASFVNSLVLLTMITAIVIMVIGNNLARAFGLVGAMSIIRFRTAVKDTQDIMFIFFALAIGLAAGVGLHGVAIVGTLFVGGVSFVFSRINFASPTRREFLLQIISNGEARDEAPHAEIIDRYCRSHKLVNVKAVGGETGSEQLEMSYYVSLKREDAGERFIGDLKRTPGIQHVNLFFDEE